MTHKFSKYLVLAIGALGLTALPALADSACATTTLDVYLSSFGGATGCTVTYNGVTLDFSHFNYTPGGSHTEAAASIGVSPAPPPGNDGPGLNFNPGIGSLTSGSTDIAVGFEVTALGGAQISDIYIALNNAHVSGTGTVSYDEQFCNLLGTCDIFIEKPVTATTSVINLSATALGGPVTSLVITKDVTIDAGASGTAGLSLFQNEYSSVPEPRAVSLVLGLGLLAGFAFFKRRQAAQN